MLVEGADSILVLTTESVRWCFGGAPKSSSPWCHSTERIQQEAKWLIRSDLFESDACETYKQVGERVPCPEKLVDYSFIIKGSVEQGERQLSSSFFSRWHASIISSYSRLGRGGFFVIVVPTWSSQGCKSYFWSLCNEQFPINYCFYLCREHVLGITNLLGSLGSIWVSCHHSFTVWGHGSCFHCMVLLLSKSACFCG